MTITYNAPKITESIGLFPISREVNSLILQDPGIYTLTGNYPWNLGTSSSDPAPTVVAAGAGHVITVGASPLTIWVNLQTVGDGGSLSISFAPTGVDGTGNVASGGGLFGAKTLVVSTTGDDTKGAASPYSAEFLTIQAAINAAAAGDTVVVRAGSYSNGSDGILKNGVNLHFLPGAIVTCNSGGALWDDNGVACTVSITGDGQFVNGAGGAVGIYLQASSHVRVACASLTSPSGSTLGWIQGATATLDIECDSIANDGTGLNLSGTTTPRVSIRARTITGAGVLCSIGGGTKTVTIAASESITNGQVLVDSGSTGATLVSIKAPTITSSASGSNGTVINNNGTGARYDVTADVLVCGFLVTLPNGEVHITSKRHTGNTSGTAVIGVVSGRVFSTTEEIVGMNGLGAVTLFGPAAEVHLLRGRILGFNNAAGFAVTIEDNAALLRLYPGVVLIAGASAASSIGLVTATTPTVLAMGAIAANKAAAAGVVVAVGSLLVSASVV